MKRIRGHAGNEGNEQADKLAKKGGKIEEKLNWWTRLFDTIDWGEEAFFRNFGHMTSHPDFAAEPRQLKGGGVQTQGSAKVVRSM